MRGNGPGRGKGLVIAMQNSRQLVADMLRRCGFPQLVFRRGILADEALRDLPDPIDQVQLDKWGSEHGVTINDMISHMGGSP